MKTLATYTIPGTDETIECGTFLNSTFYRLTTPLGRSVPVSTVEAAFDFVLPDLEPGERMKASALALASLADGIAAASL